MAKRFLVTLTTDFGSGDPYVAAMKGALLSAAPMAEIIDLSHDVPPHQIVAGAFILAGAAPFYPPGTLHVVVVDPGVGTERDILVGQFGGQYFLFPDNGVISLIQQQLPLEGLVRVQNRNLLQGEGVSPTFHGRDVFAPLAGMLLRGAEIDKLGTTPERYTLLDLPEPTADGDDLVGQVVYVDHFGNCITNIPADLVRQRWPMVDSVRVEIAGQAVGPIVGTYGFVERGQALAVFDSFGRVEIAVNQGRATEQFEAGFGTEVRLRAPDIVQA